MTRLLACAALLIAWAVGCLPEEDVRGHSGPGLVAQLVVWEEYCSSGLAVVKVSPDAQWAAIHESTGRLRVRTLSERYDVGPVVLDTQNEKVVVHDCTWCGDELIYTKTRMPSPAEAANIPDIDIPSYWPVEYLIDNSKTVAWRPATRAERNLLTDGYTNLVADQMGRRLMAFNPFSQMADQAGIESRVEAFRVPELEMVHTFILTGHGRARGTAIRPGYPWPLAWHPELDLIFYLNDPMIPTSPDYPVPVPVLTSVSVGGTREELTDTKKNRMVQGRAWEVPVPTILHGGRSVAVLLERSSGAWGIAVCNGTRMTKWLPFSVRFPFPKGLSEHGQRWQLITCTPEGRYGLFQWKPFSENDDREAPRPLWVWDLEEGWGQHLADLREIKLCFGWVSEDGLMIGSAAEGVPVWSGLFDYGVLRLSKQNRQG